MRIYIKSLRRVYKSGRVSDVRIAELFEEGIIKTQEEYDYVIA